MKGIIFNLLESLVIEKFGDEANEEIYAECNFLGDAPPFLGPVTYEDSDLLAIVDMLSEKVNLPVDDLLYKFGKYSFPILAEKFPNFLENIDSALEFLKNVNDIIHLEVRKLLDEAHPPVIIIEETGADRASLHYISQRKLCRMLEGILEGVADHFKGKISYSHRQCMKDGASECILDIEFS